MSQTRSKNAAQRRRRKTLLSVGGITLAAGGLALGVAAPANATATTTQVQTGWTCPYITLTNKVFYVSSIYGNSDQCVAVNDWGYWIDLGPASPVYSTVTTYTASFDSPGPGSTVTSATPRLSGTAKPGDTVTIKDGSGKTLGTTVADGNGNWSFTPTSPLPNGSNTLTATQSSDGNTASRTFTVNAPTPPPASAAVTITSPTNGSAYLNDGKSPFTGTGQPGATVTVKDASGNAVCTTTVGSTGTWSCQPASGALTPADGSKITVQQDDHGTITTASVVLDVADPLGGPIVEPGGLALAGGVLLAAVGAEGLRRRRRHITQA